MRRGLVLLVVLRLLLGIHAHAENQKSANPALVRTFTTKKAVRLSDVVVEFVTDLIQKNAAGLHDQYAKLTTATETKAARRFQARPFEGIQWWVVQASWDGDGARSSNTGEYIYLEQFQII